MTHGKNASLESFERKTTFIHIDESRDFNIFFLVITVSFWVGTSLFF